MVERGVASRGDGSWGRKELADWLMRMIKSKTPGWRSRAQPSSHSISCYHIFINWIFKHLNYLVVFPHPPVQPSSTMTAANMNGIHLPPHSSTMQTKPSISCPNWRILTPVLAPIQSPKWTFKAPIKVYMKLHQHQPIPRFSP